MECGGYVYILASRAYGTLYVGVTAGLVKRIWQHREENVAGFTQRSSMARLVWFEKHDSITAAIEREKRLRNGIVMRRLI